jgi:hypothetical protein
MIINGEAVDVYFADRTVNKDGHGCWVGIVEGKAALVFHDRDNKKAKVFLFDREWDISFDKLCEMPYKDMEAIRKAFGVEEMTE